jgi:hypothetical protein
VSYKFKFSKFRPTVKEVRDFKHFLDSQFRSDLSQVHYWDTILRYDDPNTCWIVWKSIFHEILNKHAALRHRRTKANPVPWITPTIKQLLRERDYHKKGYKI